MVFFEVDGLSLSQLLAKILDSAGKLRIPREVEIAGMDFNYMEAAKADADAVVADEK